MRVQNGHQVTFHSCSFDNDSIVNYVTSFLVACRLNNSNSTTLLGRLDFSLVLLLSLSNLVHQALQIDFGLHSSAVGSWSPTPDVALVNIRARRQQRSQHEQVPVAARKMQCRIAFDIRAANCFVRPTGDVCKEELQDGIVSTKTSLHHGIAPSDITAKDACFVVLNEDLDDFGVAPNCGEHQCGLMAFVKRRAGIFVTELDKYFAYFVVP